MFNMKQKTTTSKIKKKLYTVLETLLIGAMIIIIVKFIMNYTGMFVLFGN